MQLKKVLSLSFGAVASAQNLTNVLTAQNSSLSSLNSLLATQPELVSQLSNMTNITLLAPNNEAISRFLDSSAGTIAVAMPDIVSALLTYHVLDGTYDSTAFTSTSRFLETRLTNSTYANVTGGQRVEAKLNGSSVNIISGLLQQSTVTTANINFTGGIIHIIDRVLTIPESDSATAVAANLTSLAGALTQTNLVNAVDSLRDVTIFVPSNAAFQAIGSSLANLTNEQLTSILSYHIVNGTVAYSPDLTNTTLTTMNGEEVRITVENRTVYVNSAKVITPDVLVANGVVHIIDGVLNPNNTSAEPNPTTTSVVFVGATSVSTVPFTSGITATTTITSIPTQGSTSTSKAFGNRLAMPTGAVGVGMLVGGAAMMVGY